MATLVTDEMADAFLEAFRKSNADLRAAIEAIAPMIRNAALEEAEEAVQSAGWYSSSPSVSWDIVDDQVFHSVKAISALKTTQAA